MQSREPWWSWILEAWRGGPFTGELELHLIRLCMNRMLVFSSSFSSHYEMSVFSSSFSSHYEPGRS
jgi:hypothetical protein